MPYGFNTDKSKFEIEGGMVLLWENPDPTAVFNAQTVTLEDAYTNYDFIEIVYKFRNEAGTLRNTHAVSKLMADAGYSGYIAVDTITGQQTYIAMRQVTLVDTSEDNTVQFSTGTILQGQNTTVSSSPNYCIPLAIIGYKVS